MDQIIVHAPNNNPLNMGGTHNNFKDPIQSVQVMRKIYLVRFFMVHPFIGMEAKCSFVSNPCQFKYLTTNYPYYIFSEIVNLFWYFNHESCHLYSMKRFCDDSLEIYFIFNVQISGININIRNKRTDMENVVPYPQPDHRSK